MILEAKELRKTYKSSKNVETISLDGITFDVKKGEMVAIMGSSGSGKTTLINSIAGLLKFDSGRVDIDGNNILEMSKDQFATFRRKNVGIVFQNYNLLDCLTVAENIKVPLILEKEAEDEMDMKVKNIAQIMGLESVMDKYPYEISGGQQQRVGICRAIINNAKLIFADEPTGNLDSKSTKNVMEYFSKVNNEFGTSLLMVTHDPVTASYCHRVIYLQDGKIVAEVKRDGDRTAFYESIIETQKEYIK